MKAIVTKRYIALLAVLTVAAAIVSLTSCHAENNPPASAVKSSVYITNAPLLG